MSDYMFMLESHLSPGQLKVVADVEAAAGEAGVNLFLTGGVMRDMLGGFAVRDLDFSVEGDALKLARSVAKKTGAVVLSTDSLRKSAELLCGGDVTVEISMARREDYPKPGGRPQVQAATIHEDLLRRDFTVNAIALSINRASRGLLLDPNNGLADLERRELRATGNYSLFDDPSRLLRLVRLRVRLGFSVEARTKQQYQSAREAEMERKIPIGVLSREIRQIAEEPNPAELVAALDQEKLMPLFSPAFTGAKLNLPGLAKLQKGRQMIPYGIDFGLESPGLFLYLLTEKLTAREKKAFAARLAIGKRDLDSWQHLEARSRKLERELRSPKLRRASQVYQLLRKAPCEQVLFLYVHSSHRLVHDRVRNYLQKYLLTAQEITEREVIAAGAETGTAKFQTIKEEMVAARLDGRTKKPPPPEPPPAVTNVRTAGRH